MAGFLDEVKGNLLPNAQIEALKQRFMEALKAEMPHAAQVKIDEIKSKILEKIRKGNLSLTSRGKEISGEVDNKVDFENAALSEMAETLKQNGMFDTYYGYKESKGDSIHYRGYMRVWFKAFLTSRFEIVTREERGFLGRKKIKNYQIKKECYGLSELGLLFVKSLLELAKKEGVEICLNCDTEFGTCPVILEVVERGYGSDFKISYRMIV